MKIIKYIITIIIILGIVFASCELRGTPDEEAGNNDNDTVQVSDAITDENESVTDTSKDEIHAIVNRYIQRIART